MAKIIILLSVAALLFSGCGLILLSVAALLPDSRDEVSNSILTETPPQIPISAVKK
jgi:hypothetical protein